MNLCSNGHEEICHEGRECPFCAKIQEMKTDIDDLENKLDAAKDEIDNLQSENP